MYLMQNVSFWYPFFPGRPFSFVSNMTIFVQQNIIVYNSQIYLTEGESIYIIYILCLSKIGFFLLHKKDGVALFLHTLPKVTPNQSSQLGMHKQTNAC